MAEKSPFHKLKDPAPIFANRSHSTDVMYYWDDANCIFIATDSDTVNGGIWKYDLDQQIITEKYEYPLDLDVPVTPRCMMDIEQNIMYLMNAYTDLLSFDLKSKQFNTSLCAQQILFANITYIPSPINQLHLTMNNSHFQFDQENKSLIKLKDNIGSRRDDEGDLSAKFIYNANKKQLMMFQEECDDILVCDITDINTKNQQLFEWKTFSTKLPFNTGCHWDFIFLLGWNQIIFWLDFGENDENIWCLDLLHNDRWFMSNEIIPEYANFAALDKNNYVHFMCLVKNAITNPVHYKISLHDLLPLEIIKLNIKRYDPLIIGYIKQCEKDEQFPFIPVYLKQLILQFYPIFI